MGLRSSGAAQDFRLPSEPPPADAVATNSGGSPVIENCTVDLIDPVELPATEAGVLVFQGMKEGANVKSEDVIAKIDARMAEMQKRIAVYKFNAAVKRANDEIEIEYSKKAAEVADAEYQEMLEVQSRMAKAFTDPEMRKAKLDSERSVLAVEKAANDQKLALLDAYAAKGEVDAAAVSIERRTILAPFDGQVVKVFRRQQEWVNPGDPILQLIRMDTLQVDGWVYLEDYSPDELAGCEVTIEVPGAKGRVEKANGRIVWIDPVLTRGDRSQKMMVRAEIANRTKNDQWVILPNMRAKMTIHLGTGGQSVGSRVKQPN